MFDLRFVVDLILTDWFKGAIRLHDQGPAWPHLDVPRSFGVIDSENKQILFTYLEWRKTNFFHLNFHSVNFNGAARFPNQDLITR